MLGYCSFRGRNYCDLANFGVKDRLSSVVADVLSSSLFGEPAAEAGVRRSPGGGLGEVELLVRARKLLLEGRNCWGSDRQPGDRIRPGLVGS